jgi:hypothetical protein
MKKDRKKTRKRDHEAEREQMRRWRAANPERAKATRLAAYARNRKKLIADRMAYNRAHPEKHRATRKE